MSQPVPPETPTAPSAVASAGADRFAAQRAVLASVAERPLADHAELFAAVHQHLQGALAEIDGL